MFFLISGLWGIADAVWLVQINCMYLLIVNDRHIIWKALETSLLSQLRCLPDNPPEAKNILLLTNELRLLQSYPLHLSAEQHFFCSVLWDTVFRAGRSGLQQLSPVGSAGIRHHLRLQPLSMHPGKNLLADRAPADRGDGIRYCRGFKIDKEQRRAGYGEHKVPDCPEIGNPPVD